MSAARALSIRAAPEQSDSATEDYPEPFVRKWPAGRRLAFFFFIALPSSWVVIGIVWSLIQ